VLFGKTICLFSQKKSLSEFAKYQLDAFDEDKSGNLDFEEFVRLFNAILEDPELSPDVVHIARKDDEEFEESQQ